MHDSKDGGYDSEGRYFDDLPLSEDIKVSIALVHFHTALVRTSELCREYLESHQGDLKHDEIWPGLNRSVGQLLRRIGDDVEFPKIAAKLVSKYPEIDEDLINKNLVKICDTISSIKDIVDIREIGAYPEPPKDPEGKAEWDTKLSDFSNNFLETFNEMGRMFKTASTTEFPWITPVSITITIDASRFL